MVSMGPPVHLRDNDEVDRDIESESAVPVIAAESALLEPRLAKISGLTRNADAGLQSVHDLLQSRGPHATLPSSRGLVAEVAHATSFNADAINKGSGIRAQVVPGGKAADLRIYDAVKPDVDLGQAQLKISNNPKYLEKLTLPKYDGMQKVVAEGMQDASRGHSAALQHGDVSSKPLTVEQADQITLDPKPYFDSMKPNIVTEAAGAGMQSAVIGAALGAAVTLGSALVSRGEITKEDAKQAVKAVAVSGAAGGTAGVVGTLLRSPTTGGIAGGMVLTACDVIRAKDSKERRKKAVTGTAGVVTGTVAGTAASSAVTWALGAVLAGAGVAAWPVTLTAGVAAGFCADRAARKLAEDWYEGSGAPMPEGQPKATAGEPRVAGPAAADAQEPGATSQKRTAAADTDAGETGGAKEPGAASKQDACAADASACGPGNTGTPVALADERGATSQEAIGAASIPDILSTAPAVPPRHATTPAASTATMPPPRRQPQAGPPPLQPRRQQQRAQQQQSQRQAPAPPRQRPPSPQSQRPPPSLYQPPPTPSHRQPPPTPSHPQPPQRRAQHQRQQARGQVLPVPATSQPPQQPGQPALGHSSGVAAAPVQPPRAPKPTPTPACMSCSSGAAHIDRGTLFVECPLYPAGTQDSSSLVEALQQRVEHITGTRPRILNHCVEAPPGHGPGGKRSRLRIRLTVSPTAHRLIYNSRAQLAHGALGSAGYFPDGVKVLLALTDAGLAFREAHQGVFEHLAAVKREPSWRGTHLMALRQAGGSKWERVDIEATLEAMRAEKDAKRTADREAKGRARVMGNEGGAGDARSGVDFG